MSWRDIKQFNHYHVIISCFSKKTPKSDDWSQTDYIHEDNGGYTLYVKGICYITDVISCLPLDIHD